MPLWFITDKCPHDVCPNYVAIYGRYTTPTNPIEANLTYSISIKFSIPTYTSTYLHDNLSLNYTLTAVMPTYLSIDTDNNTIRYTTIIKSGIIHQSSIFNIGSTT